MIFNTINPIIKKDAMWIPLTNGVSTYAPDPSNWTTVSFTLDRIPNSVVVRGYYGGHETFDVLRPHYVVGGNGAIWKYSIDNGVNFRNLVITSGPNAEGPSDAFTALQPPLTLTLEFNGSVYDHAYCPIYDPE